MDEGAGEAAVGDKGAVMRQRPAEVAAHGHFGAARGQDDDVERRPDGGDEHTVERMGVTREVAQERAAGAEVARAAAGPAPGEERAVVRGGEGDEAARALAAAVALDIRAGDHRAHAVADEVAALAGREVVGDEVGELPGEYVEGYGAVVGLEAGRKSAAASGFKDFAQAAHVALVAENAVDEHDGRELCRVGCGNRGG